ncbi:MAG: alpha-galactosidase [Halobacteria archaeon]
MAPVPFLEAPGGRVEGWEALFRISADGRKEGSRTAVTGFPAAVSVGSVRLAVEAATSGPGQIVLRSTVTNGGDRGVALRTFIPAAITRWSLDGGSPGRLRVLQNGWQSWSFAGSRSISARTVMSRFRPSRRALWDAADSDPPGHHRSELFTLLHDPEGGGALLAGFLGATRAFGDVRVLGGRGEWPRVEAVLRMDGALLGPGESRPLEPLHVAVGKTPHALLRRYLEALASASRARVPREPVAGWCSWYHYFNRVTEEDLRGNLGRAAEGFPRPGGVQRLFQLDDGYPRAVGDWLETNPKFPSGLKAMAAEIRKAGFTPGLWTAPFLATRNSRLWREHPDWLLNHPGKPRRAAYNPFWDSRPACALDTTRPEFLEHLRRTYATLAGWGFTYHKIDFLYAGALHGRRHDPKATRAEALRRGLEAVREGVGPDSFLLGCGCPLGPAVGLVDGMRVGCDVAPSWETRWSRLLGPGAPSTRWAIHNALTRAPMHRVLWLNDPDCAMLRPSRTRLAPGERDALALACAVGGGVFLVSDDLSLYGEEEWRRLRELLDLFRELETAGASARCPDLFRADAPTLLERELVGGSGTRLAVRWGSPRGASVTRF